MRAAAQTAAVISNRARSARRTHSFATRHRPAASTVTDANPYSLYLVRCRDGSLYTGIATDVARRLTEHRDGQRGARYLRGKGPLNLVYQREIGTRSLASRIERRIKRLPAAEKNNPARLRRRIDALLLELDDA